MTIEDYISVIVVRMAERTKAGELHWEQVGSRVYRCSLPSGCIEVALSGSCHWAWAYDPQRNRLGEVCEPEHPKSSPLSLETIYKVARESALGASALLTKMLIEVG